MKRVWFTRGRWIALAAVLGVFSLIAPLPGVPTPPKHYLLASGLLGLAYGWAVGLASWHWILGPVLDPDVPKERKRRIAVATLCGAAVTAAAIGWAHYAGVLPR